MPLDAYSFCPGGTGKKIKFCCPDLLGDHQKIERMLVGGQLQAALNHVERLEEKHPGRACLMARRCLLLQLLDRLDEAESAVAEFLQQHPANPVALAETAVFTAVKQGGRAAMPWVQRAMEAVETTVPPRVWQMLGVVGQALAQEGEFLAARTVLHTALALRSNAPNLADLLGEMLRTRELPIWFKEEPPLAKCPDNVPWKANFDQALKAAYHGRWSAAEHRFLAIAAQAGDQPAVWRNVAALRGWLADREGAVKALRKYSRLNVPLEDAVEAEAKAMFLGGDPLGDQADVLSLTYPIVDVQQFQAAIASSRQFRPLSVNPAAFAEGDEPPPLAVYAVLDGDPPSGDAPIELANLPRVLCQAAYYGKQTDREARLLLFPVAAAEEQAIHRLLSQLLFGVLGPVAERRVTDRASRTLELIAMNRWLPSGVNGKLFVALNQRHCEEALLQQWPNCPLGVLDGKTPQEAARDPKYLVPLLAAILVVESWTDRGGLEFDGNRLRARLGLPTLDPIDPEQVDISTLPVGRLSRVMEQKLPRAELLEAFHRAAAFHYLPAIRKFGRALVDHPESADQDERAKILSFMAQVETDPDRCLACIDEGRRLSESAGASSAPWDLIELSLHLARGEPEEIGRLLNHLTTEHLREPGVAAAVHDVLVRLGVITPEGAPVKRSPGPAQAEPSLTVPTPEGAEPGKLWTPGGESGGGGKPTLWTPGMD